MLLLLSARAAAVVSDRVECNQHLKRATRATRTNDRPPDREAADGTRPEAGPIDGISSQRQTTTARGISQDSLTIWTKTAYTQHSLTFSSTAIAQLGKVLLSLLLLLLLLTSNRELAVGWEGKLLKPSGATSQKEGYVHEEMADLLHAAPWLTLVRLRTLQNRHRRRIAS